MKQQVDSATEKLLDLDSINNQTVQKVCNFEWWLSSTLDASTLTAVLDMIRHSKTGRIASKAWIFCRDKFNSFRHHVKALML